MLNQSRIPRDVKIKMSLFSFLVVSNVVRNETNAIRFRLLEHSEFVKVIERLRIRPIETFLAAGRKIIHRNYDQPSVKKTIITY